MVPRREPPVSTNPDEEARLSAGQKREADLILIVCDDLDDDAGYDGG